MIFAVDCQYVEHHAAVTGAINTSATAAGILFNRWDDATPSHTFVKQIDDVAPYVPGQFYQRELPCIVALLAELKQPPKLIVVDGYVTLGEAAKPGLGWHLYQAVAQQIPVIGVAKKPFIGTPATAEIFRGNSQNPLYVSSIGVALPQAKQWVLSMHGKHRLPSLLKYVDQLARGIVRET
ncbi:endonuclease V [Shewanella sp. C32]|uniref:Endonuclease V n=1 Tax=Shewanella electrica TaxID=515560 RepID=A0ABT2FFU2_9GAMM|nr:endonuclease V [Shewanella electrica]MCH1925332.1 endonuclease V [Shewanella electrica]MCS4555157.1 endonuclease V [Shewanella electrica]